METVGSLIEIIRRTKTVKSFRFRLDKKIDFLPGQYMAVMLEKEDEDLHRLLSFSSSPFREYIEFTKRITFSKFCEKLRRLKRGDKVYFRLPLGECVFRPQYQRVGFLIGGIGITPVISMIEYIDDQGLDTDILLFYSNSNEKEIAFYEELNNWQKKLNMKVVYLVTKEKPQNKHIYYGRLTKEFLEKYLPELRNRIFFTYGPPGMVEAMKDILLEIGFRKEIIKTEKFIGY